MIDSPSNKPARHFSRVTKKYFDYCITYSFTTPWNVLGRRLRCLDGSWGRWGRFVVVPAFPASFIKEVLSTRSSFCVLSTKCQLQTTLLHPSIVETANRVGLVRRFSVPLYQTMTMPLRKNQSLVVRHGVGSKSSFFAKLAFLQVFISSWGMSSARGFRTMGWRPSWYYIWPECWP